MQWVCLSLLANLGGVGGFIRNTQNHICVMVRGGGGVWWLEGCGSWGVGVFEFLYGWLCLKNKDLKFLREV